MKDKAKPIMIQGTMSSSGKSLFAAALCRIFLQDGYKVAPFKAQNMTSETRITKDGREIARSQALQAEAAGIEPLAEMNPVLIKPVRELESQVIINGRVLGTMGASAYSEYKLKLIPEIRKAYNTMAAKYDLIVIEGAGSPAEINLPGEDIANMGMAKLAQTPVILIGDIDRGGVFASLYGTISLLEELKKMVKGIVINKFRGDPELLKPGLEIIEKKTGIPVLGVVPYLPADLSGIRLLEHVPEDNPFNLLAEEVRKAIDMKAIYRILEEGV